MEPKTASPPPPTGPEHAVNPMHRHAVEKLEAAFGAPLEAKLVAAATAQLPVEALRDNLHACFEQLRATLNQSVVAAVDQVEKLGRPGSDQLGQVLVVPFRSFARTLFRKALDGVTETFRKKLERNIELGSDMAVQRVVQKALPATLSQLALTAGVAPVDLQFMAPRVNRALIEAARKSIDSLKQALATDLIAEMKREIETRSLERLGIDTSDEEAAPASAVAEAATLFGLPLDGAQLETANKLRGLCDGPLEDKLADVLDELLPAEELQAALDQLLDDARELLRPTVDAGVQETLRLTEPMVVRVRRFSFLLVGPLKAKAQKLVGKPIKDGCARLGKSIDERLVRETDALVEKLTKRLLPAVVQQIATKIGVTVKDLKFLHAKLLELLKLACHEVITAARVLVREDLIDVARFRTESHVAGVLKLTPPPAPVKRTTAEAAAKAKKTKAPAAAAKGGKPAATEAKAPAPATEAKGATPAAQPAAAPSLALVPSAPPPKARLVRAAIIAALALGVVFGALTLNKAKRRPAAPAKPAAATRRAK